MMPNARLLRIVQQPLFRDAVRPAMQACVALDAMWQCPQRAQRVLQTQPQQTTVQPRVRFCTVWCRPVRSPTGRQLHSTV